MIEEELKEGAKERLDETLITFTALDGHKLEVFFSTIDGIKGCERALRDPLIASEDEAEAEVVLIISGQEYPIRENREEVIDKFADHVVENAGGGMPLQVLKQAFSEEGDSTGGLDKASVYSPIDFNQGSED